MISKQIIEALKKSKACEAELSHITGIEFDQFQKQNNKSKTECWFELGRPYVWHIAEQYGETTVLIDSGWGFMAVYNRTDGLIQATSSNMIEIGDVIVLDKEYYGTESYIHIRAQAIKM